MQDSFPFGENNIPWLYLGVDDFDNYHTTKDTYQSIDKENFIKNANICLDIMIAVDKNLSHKA